MFSKKMEQKIDEAVKEELEQAKASWGCGYNSMHEAYAVLKEEVEEADDKLEIIKIKLEHLWGCVKCNSKFDDGRAKDIGIGKFAKELAKEAVQICAVCQKIQDSNFS